MLGLRQCFPNRLIMRRRLSELLAEHGETEVTRNYVVA